MKKRESIDLALILIWPIIAMILSFLIKPNSLTSIILFLGLPAIYLSFQGKEYVKKVFLFSIAVSIPLMIVLDYISHLTGDWYIFSSIPYRLFGFVSFEVLLWAFSTCYFIIIFYEYFINKHRTKKTWSPKIKYIAGAGVLLLIVFLILLVTLPSLLNIPYFYLIWGTFILLIPFLFQLFKYPKTTSKFFLAGAYFFYLHFIYEVTGLKLRWWTFPGPNFIGWVNMFGIGFPVEEIIFWFILLALTTISYYEYFDDDEK